MHAQSSSAQKQNQCMHNRCETPMGASHKHLLQQAARSTPRNSSTNLQQVAMVLVQENTAAYVHAWLTLQELALDLPAWQTVRAEVSTHHSPVLANQSVTG
jgi:hypothetical protein